MKRDMARKSSSSDAALKELRAFGLAYPGAHTKSPWPGHLDLAVTETAGLRILLGDGAGAPSQST